MTPCADLIAFDALSTGSAIQAGRLEGQPRDAARLAHAVVGEVEHGGASLQGCINHIVRMSTLEIIDDMEHASAAAAHTADLTGGNQQDRAA